MQDGNQEKNREEIEKDIEKDIKELEKVEKDIAKDIEKEHEIEHDIKKDIDELKELEEHHEKEFIIIVNGQEKKWEKGEISFDQVIDLAFGPIMPNPMIEYTVSFKNARGNNPSGHMVKGDIVKVKNGTIFNATSTNRS